MFPGPGGMGDDGRPPHPSHRGPARDAHFRPRPPLPAAPLQLLPGGAFSRVRGRRARAAPEPERLDRGCEVGAVRPFHQPPVCPRHWRRLS